MFRLRISLIIQILASELARLRNLSAEGATQQLLSISPFEVKCMLFSILSGRLLEDAGADDEEEAGVKELRTGMGSFRKQIEERKSKSMRVRLQGGVKSKSSEDLSREGGGGEGKTSSPSLTEETSDSDDSMSLPNEFQFGIWLRHRRIDGALNRVPPDFYSSLWDTVRLFPCGLSVNHTILHRSLTQEMTRREIKFALQVEEVLNQISEPEYRELVVETLTFLGHLDKLLVSAPNIPGDRAFEVEQVLYHANKLFVENNVRRVLIITNNRP
jgi:phosphorylase kinase alpha/beta subunit